mgnify:CR=1 FL=1
MTPPTRMLSQETVWLSTRVITIASSIPHAESRLPWGAVAGDPRRLRPTMNSAEATR